MCGIAGLITRDGSPPCPATLDRLADALGHRGPDGRGRHLRAGVGMIQTRLAIIDLEGGRQPILDYDGCAIVANGEIYNDPELRAAMPGQLFRTGSDSESPLHLYRRAGLDFAARLRGMFALAIDDATTGRVVLARDPFGIKPLYWCEGPFGFAFASEAGALLAAGFVPRGVRADKALELLQLQFTTGGETIVPGIHRVHPGQTLVIENGRIIETRRTAALGASDPTLGDEFTLIGRLDEVLANSVDVHQRADVPFGMFLSGGIDSSALLALMARLNRRPVLAFTAGFPGTQIADERRHALFLAKTVGAEAIDVPFDADDFWSLLPRVAAAMDDPAADYACLPTFKLAEVARRHVKVILSGEGGDELFAGYGRYRDAARVWFPKKMRRKGTFDGLGILRSPATGWRDGIALAERDEAQPGRTRLQIAQAIDCADWLPNDLLIKADRCLMANGIEGRVPFLDAKVAAFAFNLPDRFKVRGRTGKWLLRRWLDGVLPEAQGFLPKRGFTVPVADWIKARPEIGPLVAAQPGIAELADPAAVTSLFRHIAPKTGFAAWSLLFYALWHRHHVLNRPVAPDAFSALTDLG